MYPAKYLYSQVYVRISEYLAESCESPLSDIQNKFSIHFLFGIPRPVPSSGCSQCMDEGLSSQLTSPCSSCSLRTACLDAPHSSQLLSCSAWGKVLQASLLPKPTSRVCQEWSPVLAARIPVPSASSGIDCKCLKTPWHRKGERKVTRLAKNCQGLGFERA